MMFKYGNTVPDELVAIAEGRFDAAVNGKSDQFLYNIDVYIKNSSVAQMLAQQGDFAIKNLKDSKGKLLIKADTQLNPMYCAIHYLLDTNIFVGVDTSKEDYSPALYTRSVSLLSDMLSGGYLLPETDMTKIKDAMEGSKSAKGIEEDSYCVVRLDIAGYAKGRPIYKAVIPKTRIQIGVQKQFVFIPLRFMHAFHNFMVQKFSNKVFRYTKQTVRGPITHIATMDQEIVRKVYGNDNRVHAKLMKTHVGYNVGTLHFNAYDLESSLNTVGTATFRPEMLNELKVVSVDRVDKSQHDINYDFLRGIFKTRVRKMRTDELMSFSDYVNLQGFPTNEGRVQALCAFADDCNPRDLYNIMKASKLFGDIDEALKTRERISPKALKQMVPVALTMVNTDTLRDMLKRGIVKFTAVTKSNSVYERVCSNNPRLLAQMLGKDYVAKFESPRKRMQTVIKVIEKNKELGKVISGKDLEYLLVKYNLTSFLDNFITPADLAKDVIDDNIVDTLEQISDNMPNNQKEGSDYVTYRNLYAMDSSGYFGMVNVNNLISLEFAEVSTK